MLSGPAETGKTFAVLYKVDTFLRSYPGAQVTIARKVRATMYGSVLKTYDRIRAIKGGVMPFGGQMPEWYDYPNGSRLWVAGLDNPGKALSSISLLSGGEMAFVAIALYFAIMKVRPTPFCVMDEIEAALDEANVIRYAEYMRKMSDKTQFIVITHRRGTMEEANHLYGVTMQEKGVSKVIALDLAAAQKTIESAKR